MSTTRTPTRSTAPSTRTLLLALVVSSPLWASVSVIQAATREGFDITTFPLSMLATGDLAWLQITNFVVTGSLALVGAVGMRRAVPGRWVPRLVGVYGLGYILAGVLTLDPGGGFPAGAPDAPTTMSWHAVAHLLVGTIAFVALAAVLIAFGRHFVRRHEPGWAAIAFTGGALVILGNILAGTQIGSPSLAVAVGVISGMLALSPIAAKVRADACGIQEGER